MTQRPVPTARYSRLLNQDSGDATDKSPPANIDTPSLALRPTAANTIYFVLGILTSVLLSSFLRRPLSNTLCVTSYHHDTTFTPRPEYANLSAQYDTLWEDILPSNGGFVNFLSGSTNVNSNKGKKPMGITMFHQLHCLQLLRIGLQRAHHDDGDQVEDGMVKDTKGHNMHANDHHYLHCLDYLRQTTLCAADHTREPTIVRKKPGMKLVDGYVKHRCGDSQALYDLVKGGDA